METRAPAPVGSARFWRAFATTLRPYLMIISGSAGMVGLALAGDLEWPVFVGSSMVFFLTYGLGQSVTDVFQTDTDALSAPERPLVRRVVRRQDVLGVALAGLALCAVWFAALNPWTLVVSALCVFGLVSYTPMKRRWWAGPAWNGWIVALLPLAIVASPTFLTVQVVPLYSARQVAPGASCSSRLKLLPTTASRMGSTPPRIMS